MSWDLFVQDLPADAESVADIPSDFKPRSIGRTSEVISVIRTVAPAVDFSRPSWGVIDGDGGSIEINIADEE